MLAREPSAVPLRHEVQRKGEEEVTLYGLFAWLRGCGEAGKHNGSSNLPNYMQQHQYRNHQMAHMPPQVCPSTHNPTLDECAPHPSTRD